MREKTYKITIDGCDDSTTFTMELCDLDANVVRRICEKSVEASTYGCQPTMKMERE